MLIGDIMSGKVVTLDPGASVSEAARNMQAADVGAMPVVDGRGQLLGMLTDRDIVLRCVAAGRSPSRCRVKEILSGGVVTVSAETTVEEAAQMMARHKIRRLPVTRRGRLIGMVSLGDLAIRNPLRQSVSETLLGISRAAGRKKNRRNKL